ncbi:glucose-1-phosphate adenylyltransferase large subunit 2 chloroplastic-like, partial [Trifolium medium]|nr:glucose-1-phosphate adenylyltransferase large subunit 2 chloroplastic-like [Trifolium medium]
LSPEEAKEHPYIASMGVYVFRTETLLELLRLNGSTCNDFGSEIIPSAVSGHNVQAFLFNDYWEDIGTIKSFFDANLALTENPDSNDFAWLEVQLQAIGWKILNSRIESCTHVCADSHTLDNAIEKK